MEILDFRRDIDEEARGNPYNCSFRMRVVSGAFSGVADGCEYDYTGWKAFVRQLQNVYLLKAREAELLEIGYGSRILFRGDRLGHITVFGKIYGDAMSHALKFEFETDQTVYPDFLEELNRLGE